MLHLSRANPKIATIWACYLAKIQIKSELNKHSTKRVEFAKDMEVPPSQRRDLGRNV